MDPRCFTDEANPCNNSERMNMIEGALSEAGLPLERIANM